MTPGNYVRRSLVTENWVCASLSNDGKKVSVEHSSAFDFTNTLSFMEVIYSALKVYLDAKSQEQFTDEAQIFKESIDSLSRNFQEKMETILAEEDFI